MEIPEIVNQIVDYIPTVDFTKTDDQVSLFETTVNSLRRFMELGRAN
jgi:mannosyl-oligosaccharide alpha-1,2-mannosidase